MKIFKLLPYLTLPYLTLPYLTRRGLFVLLMVFSSFTQIFAQTYKVEFRIKSTDNAPQRIVDGKLKFSNEVLTSLFANYNVSNFGQSYPSAAKIKHPLCPALLRCYYVELERKAAELLTSLNAASSYFDRVHLSPEPGLLSIPPSCTPVTTNDPADAPWNMTRHELMHVQEAWCETTGNPDIRIAVIDNGFDVSNNDLVNKIDYIDPDVIVAAHGTGSATAAAGDTDNGVDISSSGYNCRLIVYDWSDAYDKMLDAASRGAKVTTNSYIAGCNFDQNDQDIINVVTDLGVITVAASGNGNFGAHCPGNTLANGNVNGLVYPASYDNVISVSSINTFSDFEDTWDCYANDFRATPWVATHNNSVDLVAQGFCVKSIGDNNRHLFASGTSIAAPQVAGVIGLMLSVNPCLKAPDVDRILKQTGTNIATIGNNASYYPNGTVPVIPNAYEAVKAARDYGIHTITSNTTWNTEHYATNIVVKTGAELKINATKVVLSTNARIIVERGARLIIESSTLTNACWESKWDGIFVHGNSLVPQPSNIYGALVPDRAGIVIVKNNSTIEFAKTAISTSAPELSSSAQAAHWGGLVYVENSTFSENFRGIEFMKYDLTNESKILGCTFENSTQGVSIWACKDVLFLDNRFKDLESGISGVDYTASIGHNPNPSSIGGKNYFENITVHAIEVWATSSTSFNSSSFYIEKNDFTNCFAAIVMGSPNRNLRGVKITENNMFNCTIGEWIDGAVDHLTQKNTFYNGGLFSLAARTKNGIGNFLCNTVSTSGHGLYFYGENDFSKILNNDFSNILHSDIALESWGTTPATISPQQGNPAKPAGNCFSANNQDDIRTELPTARFIYFEPSSFTRTCEDANNNITDSGTNNYETKKSFNVATKDCDPSLLRTIANPPSLTASSLRVLQQKVNEAYRQSMADENNLLLKANHQDAEQERDALLMMIVESAINENSYATTKNILTENNSHKAKELLYSMYLKFKEYDKALVALNNMTGDDRDDLAAYKVIQAINIERLRTNEFVLNSTQEALLDSYANSESSNRGHARALLVLLKGRHFEYHLPNHSEQRSYNKNQSLRTVKDYTIAPNPAQDHVIVKYPSNKHKKHLALHDLFGHVVASYGLDNSGEFRIDTNTLSSGIYLLNIVTENGNILFQDKLVIQTF